MPAPLAAAGAAIARGGAMLARVGAKMLEAGAKGLKAGAKGMKAAGDAMKKVSDVGRKTVGRSGNRDLAPQGRVGDNAKQVQTREVRRNVRQQSDRTSGNRGQEQDARRAEARQQQERPRPTRSNIRETIRDVRDTYRRIRDFDGGNNRENKSSQILERANGIMNAIANDAPEISDQQSSGDGSSMLPSRAARGSDRRPPEKQRSLAGV